MRSKFRYLFIYIAALAVLALIPLSLAKRGGVSKTADDVTYLYLPSEYTPGVWVHFNEIRSENCDGAEPVYYKNGGALVSRLFVAYEYNSVDKNHIEIYISPENASPEELNTAPEKFEKVRLYPFDGVDDFTLLKAFNQSSDKEASEGTRRIAERTADILSESFTDELSENLSLTDDFEIVVCEGKLDELS